MSVNLPPKAQAVFKALMQGDYLSPLGARELWTALDDHAGAYSELFDGLGHSLVIDPRGFAYLEQADKASSVNKRSKQLAVLLVELFTLQMDRNQSPLSFQEWLLDEALMNDVIAHGGETLRAVELGDAAAIDSLLASATRRRLANRTPRGYQLLRPIHLYLDAFLRLTINAPDAKGSDAAEGAPQSQNSGHQPAWGEAEPPTSDAHDDDLDDHGIAHYGEEEPE